MTELSQKKRSPLAVVLISYVCITGLWALYRFFLDTPLNALFPTPAGALLEGVIKCLLLILPSVLLMRACEDDLFIPTRQAFSLKPRALLTGLVLGAVFLGFYVVRNLIVGGGVRFNFAVSTDDLLSSVFFAAVTEEIMYRAFMQNVLVKKFGRERAIVIAAVLFAFMHLPIWIAGGTVDVLELVVRLLSVGLTGYLLGLAFVHDKVIWGAVIAHGLHNLIVHVVVSAK